MQGALVCGVWEIVITFAPWLLILLLESWKKRSQENLPVEVQSNFVEERPRFLANRYLSRIAVAGAFIFPLSFLVILDRSTWEVFFQSPWWIEIFPALLVSLKLASFTALLTLLTSVTTLVTLRSLRWMKGGFFSAGLSLLHQIPGGMSILVLGLGYWLSYGYWVDPFDGAVLFVVALQATLFVPFALRVLAPISQSMQIRELEAAMTLGAGPIRGFWMVEWPRWKEPVTRVLSLSAALALGELGAVSLFYSEKWISLPLLVSRWMQQYRFEDAQGVSALLLVLSWMIVWTTKRSW
jgi:ABC-type Fe3+ transport system permease subunit